MSASGRSAKWPWENAADEDLGKVLVLKGKLGIRFMRRKVSENLRMCVSATEKRPG